MPNLIQIGLQLRSIRTDITRLTQITNSFQTVVNSRTTNIISNENRTSLNQRSFELNLNRTRQDFTLEISNTREEIFDGIGDLRSILDQIRRELADLSRQVDRLEETLIHKLENESRTIQHSISLLEGSINRSFFELDLLITEKFTSINSKLIFLTGELSSVLATVIGLELEFNIFRPAITAKVNHNTQLINKLDKKLTSFYNCFKEFEKSFAIETAEVVAQRVVGESYYKWDSTSTYLPTLTLFFREKEVLSKPRVSQIKGRLPFQNKQVTNQIVSTIRKTIIEAAPLSYVYGSTRCNYQHREIVTFKTTIFAKDKENAFVVLNFLCGCLSLPFKKEFVSITENSRRQNPNRRISGLDSLDPIKQESQANTTMEFYRAVIQVNGVPPIVVYQKQDQKNINL